MSSELSEKLLDVLLNISESIKPIPFWEDASFWLSAVSIVALVVTLIFLIRYTRATENMTKYQLIPAIDVNMIYQENIGKTYFWFSNDSNLPGVVYLESRKNKEERREVYKPLRIPPKRSMKTATTFEFFPKNGDEMIIYISVKPALEKANFEIKFEKSYIFVGNQWNEKSWSFPDPPFPN